MKNIIFSIVCLFIFNTCSKKMSDASQQGQYKIKQGDIFRIKLESNPSTGYQWDFATPPDTTLLQLTKKEFISSPDSLVGAAGTEIWIFKGLKPGKTTLELQYARPWQKNRPKKTKEYKIKVK
jgi:inhibitor of cysteine peptidase